jgi:tRNA modification GTPase
MGDVTASLAESSAAASKRRPLPLRDLVLTGRHAGASVRAMADTTRDTIFALSSGRPPAAIAVVRMSGPQAAAALKRLVGKIPEPRRAALARVRDPQSGEVIDEALALWFPAPGSETGEDVAELQLHGGRAVIAAVLAALGRIEGLRPAEPGEFTRRAFENGRLDLTAVEGLADLVYAETEAQRRQAYRQLKGLLGDRAEAWRAQLTEALALVEAQIDFAEDEELPEQLVVPALRLVDHLCEEIEQALLGAARGERLRDGMVVAIAGPPNAGKSTLMNRIARRDAAIVSPTAGTTRDVIEVHLDLQGYPVTVLDTAGIRESADPVEQEGVRRARERAEGADLVLWLTDCREPVAVPGQWPTVWTVANKTDLLAKGRHEDQRNELTASNIEFRISAATGAGLDALIARLAGFAREYFTAEPALVTRDRHRRALLDTLAALKRALAEDRRGREDIIAEELRSAAAILGRLTGRIDVEDILDVIFREFCIGK